MSLVYRHFGKVFALAAAVLLAGCAGFEEMAAEQLSAKPDARILAIGDSVIWWNAESGASIPDVTALELRTPVVNLAVPGARISHPDPVAAEEGLDIRAQYRDRGWDWVIVEGGANDLGDEGGVRGCATVLNELVSADGTRGEIPALVRRVRGDGAKVIVMGYYQLPTFGEPDGFCGDSLGELSARIAKIAAGDTGVLFVGMADVVDSTDRGAFDPDAVHPSVRTSRVIGQRIAAAIRGAELR